MTVCIAAVCEGGRKVVCATDGLLSMAGVTGDTIPGKYFWIDDWCCMYAGYPHNVSLVMDELWDVTQGQKIGPDNAKKFFKQAFVNRQAKAVLGPYDLTLDEFKKEGFKMFGPEEFGRLSKEVHNNLTAPNDQLLIVGWGDSPLSVMLYQIGQEGDANHNFSGIAAIGSGQEVALSSLLSLGHRRDSSLGETLYAVAAAKFAAEKSQGLDVGMNTIMFIAWKRRPEDVNERISGKFVQADEMKLLRDTWEEFGRPRIPDEAWPALDTITLALGFQPQLTTTRLQAASRINLKQQKAEKAASSPSQQSNPQTSSGQP